MCDFTRAGKKLDGAARKRIIGIEVNSVLRQSVRFNTIGAGLLNDRFGGSKSDRRNDES